MPPLSATPPATRRIRRTVKFAPARRTTPRWSSWYRSGIYCTSEEQRKAAEASRDLYQKQLSAAGYRKITTEIIPAPDFYYAEDYHQQYLAKNPDGYCGLGGTGVSCPVGVGVATS
jgi:peptide-methionine (S)-S-oxide reductase